MAMVSEFLKQAWFMDNQEQECIKSSKGGSSVQSRPNFDPSADVSALDKAITVKGVDEATIIDILTKRTNAQRQQIKAVLCVWDFGVHSVLCRIHKVALGFQTACGSDRRNC